MLSKTKEITLAALFAAVTFAASYISFSFGSVPFTAQTCAVILSGLLLKPYTAVLAQTINVILLILFKNIMFSATLGFTIGFIICAGLIAWFKPKHLFSAIIASVIGSIAIYACGTLYFALFTGKLNDLLAVANITVFPFVLFDLLKLAIAIVIAFSLKKVFK